VSKTSSSPCARKPGRLDAGGVAQDRHLEAVGHGAGLRWERADDEQRHRRGESGRAPGAAVERSSGGEPMRSARSS
jgi:hypothetical protein